MRIGTVAAGILMAAACNPGVAQEATGFLVDEPVGVPMRVRDLTVPSFLALGFTAAPAAPRAKVFHGSASSAHLAGSLPACRTP